MKLEQKTGSTPPGYPTVDQHRTSRRGFLVSLAAGAGTAAAALAALQAYDGRRTAGSVAPVDPRLRGDVAEPFPPTQPPTTKPESWMGGDVRTGGAPPPPPPPPPPPRTAGVPVRSTPPTAPASAPTPPRLGGKVMMPSPPVRPARPTKPTSK